ncbi:DUF1643 domain-containing protein [Salinimicrobium sediminilitoris]|uniref:DUF1643 domain-containing protein n=1 Tax=Salinimicrobium sediminilitoris TaxID=2876715 RepID=UPI001E5E4AFD|nr:DUF1643 domain-containing protein [Salinimicrobium sediminilitoris]MCC8360648.1 DUF1643 domain-containing protein [Salinimicrobium sediminilitoris]
MQKQMICHPENHPDLRYLLAKKGKNNLLVVGLNPSRADAENSDPTMRNIDRIAGNNGYDGWLLVNLYPKRKPNPADLELKEETEIFWYNLHLIKHLLDRDQFKIKDAWLAWGDGVDNLNRPYLKQAAGYLYRNLLLHDLNYFSIGRTGKANPRHPSPQSVNCHVGRLEEIELLKFDFRHYVRNIKLEPEIKINGLKFD